MGVSSFFGYTMTFLSAVAIQVLLIGVFGYYTNPLGRGAEILPPSTLIMLNDYFMYILMFSLIIVLALALKLLAIFESALFFIWVEDFASILEAIFASFTFFSTNDLSVMLFFSYFLIQVKT